MKFSSVSALSFLALGLVATGSLGCDYPTTLDFNQVAMCAKVTDDGRALSGPARIQGSVLNRDTAIVWTYSGEGVLDSQGTMCLNLKNSVNTSFHEGYYRGATPVEEVLGKLDVRSLTVTVEGRSVSGVLSSVDIVSVSRHPHLEAAFDFANPNPGDPGALALFELIHRSKDRLDQSRRENEALAVGSERDERFRAEELGKDSSEAAI